MRSVYKPFFVPKDLKLVSDEISESNILGEVTMCYCYY